MSTNDIRKDTSLERGMTGSFPTRPVAAVISVLFRGDEVLLVSRKNPPDVGLWGFPGGKIEYGESIADAAVRELREETGVLADFDSVVTTVDDIVVDGEAPYHFILVAALCIWREGEPVAADDAEEVAWIPVENLTDGTHSFSLNVDVVAELAYRRYRQLTPIGITI